MKGLDLSKLKKISSDKNTTTFSHGDGHEVKIVHSKLSPKFREEIEKLPIHGKQVHKMAEGGEPAPQPTENQDSDNSQDSKPVNININTQPQGAQAPMATPAEYVPGVSPPGPVATTGNNMSNPIPEAPAPAAPVAQDGASQPASPTEPQGQGDSSPNIGPNEGPQQPQVPDDVKQHLLQEDSKWQQDLQNQHITPETYSDLFNKKGTLGKIGAVFGLMMSGAGSGLSHQPNALLAMMNQEIQNDLEAQKSSKSNAQNFLRINQQQQMNLAQKGLLGAQTSNIKAEADQRAFALANMQMNHAALHNLTQNISRLPLGSPQRQQAESTLAMMYQAVNNENYSIADRAAAASALSNFGSTSGGPEQGFQKQNQMLRMSGNDKLAENMENKHFPGIQGQASVPLTADDRTQLNSGITFQNQLQRFQDWTKAHSGDLSPAAKKEGEAMAAGLQGAYRQATHGGVYKAGEQDFISNIIDSEPTKFFNDIRVMPQLKAVQKDAALQLDQFAKSKGFQGYKTQIPASSPGEIRTDAHGNKWKLGPNGKPVRAN